MKKNLLSILILCLVSVFTYAQEYQIGLIIDGNSDAAYKEVGVYNSGAKNEELPLKSTLKEYCPPVQNQGSIGSCVGWATGYGAMTITYAKKYKWSPTEIKDKAFSALYIYNQIKVSSCPFGSRIDQAVQLLEEKGNLPSKDFDMPRDDCSRQPTDNQRTVAQNFKTKSSLTLFSLNADAKTKIYNTKKSISKGVPVIIGMQILKNFGGLRGKTYWDPTEGNTAPWGGHAMVVIGYDESRQAFEIMNSWGDSWGQDGFIWVKYNDFAKYCKYGYQIFLDENKDEPQPDEPQPDEPKPADPEISLTGSFYYRIPDFAATPDGGDIVFKKTEVKKTSDYTYEMIRKDWEVNQMFQLVAQKIKKGSHVYVFSIDPTKKAQLHYPRNEKQPNSDAVDALVERPLVPYGGESIVIPNADNALVKDKSGTDFVFILYSDREIDDIDDIMQTVRTSNDMEGALEDILDDRLVDISDITYNDNEMRFRTKKTDQGYIVPIILKQEGE